jgi:hypothetical protein
MKKIYSSRCSIRYSMPLGVTLCSLVLRLASALFLVVTRLRECPFLLMPFLILLGLTLKRKFSPNSETSLAESHFWPLLIIM